MSHLPNLGAFEMKRVVRKIIHIDIDRTELNKNKTVTLPVCADVKLALEQLIAVRAGDYSAWRKYCAGLKQEFPYPIAEQQVISPQKAITLRSEMTGGEAIVSLGVGQHQMWAMQHYRAAHTRSFLSSSGFGTMGYGLPAAIGAKVACPERLVIDIDGDGSLNMTVHELSTCHRYGIVGEIFFFQFFNGIKIAPTDNILGHIDSRQFGSKQFEKSGPSQCPLFILDKWQNVPPEKHH